MHLYRRKFLRACKYLLAGFVVYFVSWIVSITEWNAVVTPWVDRPASRETRGAVYENPITTMKTIVAYSEGKQAEIDRPAPLTCADLPSFPKVPYINRTWARGGGWDGLASWQQVPGTDVSLFAAYYDDRLPGQPFVRILASFKGRRWGIRPQLYCQTRPRNSIEMTVEVVAAKPLEIWWHEWDSHSKSVETPLLLTCSLTEELVDDSVVSVVKEPCDDPDNAFYLEPLETKDSYDRNFTVCVKDMNFETDKSQLLVEWIEVNKMLGAETIDIYVDNVCEDMENVLEYYRKNGTIRIFQVPINNNGRSLWQRRRDHIISYNDCLYRNIKESKFILPIDIDEVILPKISEDWAGLISRLRNLGWNSTMYSAVVVKNVFFFEYMQDLEAKFEHEFYNKSKFYTKRDDVRLRKGNEHSTLDINSHSLNKATLDKINLINAVIDNKNNGDLEAEEYREMYKARCASDMPESTVLNHYIRSSIVSPMGHYSKSFMLTKKVLTAFNHYPLANLGVAAFGGWPAPFEEVQMNHYKERCNATVVWECARYSRHGKRDNSARLLADRLARALASAAPCAYTATTPLINSTS